MSNTSGQAAHIDAETLMEHILLEGDWCAVHRGTLNHVTNGGKCWCDPLVLTHESDGHLSIPALQRLLDAHFQTH